MTPTDTLTDMTAPPPGQPSGPPPAQLRRSNDGRVAAGVCVGIGRYFGVDPVLFRVLFATAAFFGGAGILAYLLAWAAIPDESTARAPIDGWVASLRQRRVPVWIAVLVAVLALWLVAFSWWAPGPFLPVLLVLAVVVALLARREARTRTVTAAVPPVAAVPGYPMAPPWTTELRAWHSEAQEAGRRRRRRAAPIRLAALGGLLATFVVLIVVDVAHGIPLQVYFWVTLGIIGLGMTVGLVTRRTPLSITPLLIPAIVGAIAFGATSASLHDGVGRRIWQPTGTAASSYRLALGDATLDLRQAKTLPRRIEVTMAAGRVRLLLPRSLRATIAAHIRFGQLDVGNQRGVAAGVGIVKVLDPPAAATSAPVLIRVRLSDGNIAVDRS